MHVRVLALHVRREGEAPPHVRATSGLSVWFAIYLNVQWRRCSTWICIYGDSTDRIRPRVSGKMPTVTAGSRADAECMHPSASLQQIMPSACASATHGGGDSILLPAHLSELRCVLSMPLLFKLRPKKCARSYYLFIYIVLHFLMGNYT